MGKQTKKGVLHPDDNFFKIVMRETENARAYLVNFYSDIAATLDLDTLHLVNTSFTNKQFKTFDSDIVYRCQFKHSSEKLYFSLLWEHKSESEEHVSIQVGLYMMQALYILAKDKNTKLEPVLPLIFYNGKEAWEPKTIRQLFQEHPFFNSFETYLPNFQFLFKNISASPHEELLAIKERFFRSAMIAMSNRFKTDLLIEHISIIFEEDNKERLLSIATYFFAIVERSPKRIREAVENLEFTTKSKIMSTLTLLREEGKELGIEIGKLKGIEEGMLKGIYKKEIIGIRNMTLKQLDASTIAEFLSITKKHVENIQKELLMESQILTMLSKKQPIAKIAKKLKVSEWLVEVVGELQKNQS